MTGVNPSPRNKIAYLTLFACIVANVVDGFDVMATAFVGPTLAREWQLSSEQLGLLFSAGLAGVTLGSLFLATLADRFGRRPVALACLGLMSASMLASGFAPGLAALAVLRFITGLGVGAILPTLVTVLAEVSPTGRSNLIMGLFTAGYGVGATAGGALALLLIEQGSWQAIFIVGGMLNVGVLLLLWFVLPAETVLLGKHSKVPIVALFENGGYRVLVIIGSLYFLHMLVVFFFLNWSPRLIELQGATAQVGVTATMIANVGSLVGGLSFGRFADRYGWQRVAPFYFLALAASIAGVAAAGHNAAILYGAAGAAGFFMGGGITSLYAVAPLLFAAQVRASGTGVAIGVGRVGAMIGPALAGYAIAGGLTPAALYAISAIIPLLIGSWLSLKYPVRLAQAL